MHNRQIPPAQLWIGNHEHLAERVTTYLQQQFCATGCQVCRTCMQIRQQQHHAIVWICPEKSYTLAHIQEIHERIMFALAADEKLFFILQKADYLSTQCANSLLKSIEEPPAGYHFILCAQQLEAILPTIRSRCIVSSFKHESIDAHQQFLERYFYTKNLPDPYDFAQAVSKNSISEQLATQLAQTLLAHWMHAYTKAVSKKNSKATDAALLKVTLLKKICSTPPMSGSSGLFLKNLFMQYHARTSGT